MRSRPLLILLPLFLFAAPAAAAPLATTVTRIDVEPTLVVVPESAGATPEQRYRAAPAGRLPAATPLVLLIRLPPANSPDQIRVVSAERTGRTIRVRLETRRFTGPLAGNDVTAPLIEVALGRLPAGRHEVRVDETLLTFDRYDAPQTAAHPHPGLGATLSFELH